MPKSMNLKTTALLGAVLSSALAAQSPCFDLNIGTDLNMFDDQIIQGLALGFSFSYAGISYTDVCLDSNGSIYLGATTLEFSDYFPDEPTFLASSQPRICGLWTDFQADALGSGHIYFNAVPASGPNPAYALFTWAGVFEFGQSTPIDLQVRLDANSSVTITYGSQGAIGGTLNPSVLIGATPGGASVSNPVSFATRPVVISQNNFAQVIPVPGPTPTGFKMTWTSTTPGYVATDVVCTPNNLPGPARFDLLGRGCPTQPTVYEQFNANNPTDVSGMDFTFLPNGLGGYIVIPGIAGPFFTGFANNLGLSDDSTAAVLLPYSFPHANSVVNDIVVSSNGFVTLGATNNGSDCCSGDVFTFLNGEPRIAAWWSDLNPSSGGAVFADLDTNTGDFCITWNNVPEYGSTNLNTAQIALKANGTFEIRLASVSDNFHTYLLGYTPGHGANDPGPTDMSTITALDLGAGSSAAALRQDPQFGNLPQIGATVAIDVSGISASPQGNAVFLIIGFTELNPGVDLGLIGAGGCNAYLFPGPTDLQFLNITLGAPTTTFTITIPNNPTLVGAQAVSEAVSDDGTVNAFGWKFSNGLRWTVGI